MMDFAKVNRMLTMQSRREIAHFRVVSQHDYSGLNYCGNLFCVAGQKMDDPAAISLYRYPSPDRPAYSPSRPITGFRLFARKMRSDIGYHAEIAIDQGAGCANRGAIDTTTTIGLRLCKRHQSSLRQWQYLVWQVASTTTWSAALPARAQALWPQKCWEQTVQAQCWPVQPLAFFVTTQACAPAAKVDNRAHAGRVMNRNRRRGYASAAVLRFGDEK
jgi:hypothetical protein